MANPLCPFGSSAPEDIRTYIKSYNRSAELAFYPPMESNLEKESDLIKDVQDPAFNDIREI